MASLRKRKNPSDVDHDYFEAEESDVGEIKVMMTATGETISLEVKGLDSIAKIKLKIQTKKRIPFDHQELVFNQMVLEDINTLANLHIKKDSTLTLMTKSNEFMNINIEDRKGDTYSLEVKPSDTTSNVKAKMRGIVHALIFNGTVLEDSGTLADFNIPNGCTLTCINKSEPTMEIFVNTFTGKTISLLVYPTDTIADVKLEIRRNEGILVDEQALIFNKMVLGDHGTLFDFYINKNSTLTLMRKSRGFMCILIINTPTGKGFSLAVKPSNTIHNIKTKIQDTIHIPHDEQALIFNETVLDNTDTLADYNIKRDSTLTLMRVSSGLMRIFIKTVTGETITLEVKPSDTIHNVKSMIADHKKGLSHLKQTLHFNGKQVEDCLTLAEYHIHNESTLQCCLEMELNVFSEGGFRLA